MTLSAHTAAKDKNVASTYTGDRSIAILGKIFRRGVVHLITVAGPIFGNPTSDQIKPIDELYTLPAQAAEYRLGLAGGTDVDVVFVVQVGTVGMVIRIDIDALPTQPARTTENNAVGLFRCSQSLIRRPEYRQAGTDQQHRQAEQARSETAGCRSFNCFPVGHFPPKTRLIVKG